MSAERQKRAILIQILSLIATIFALIMTTILRSSVAFFVFSVTETSDGMINTNPKSMSTKNLSIVG